MAWKRHRPWWWRRAVVVRYLAFLTITSALMIAGGYWLMSLLVAWRVPGLHG